MVCGRPLLEPGHTTGRSIRSAEYARRTHWLAFIASLVQSLAWPLAIVAAIYLLRSYIAGLLSGQTLKRLKAGLLELDFERGVIDIETNLGEAEPAAAPDTGEAPDGGSGSEDKPHWRWRDERQYAELGRARVQKIIEAHQQLVEMLIRILVDDGYPRDQLPSVAGGAAALARIARDRGVIDWLTEESIESLTRLRNVAAHRSGRPAQSPRRRRLSTRS